MQKYASAKGPSWTITDNGGADLFDEAMECMLEACRFDGDDTRYQSAASHILMSKYYHDGYADTDTIRGHKARAEVSRAWRQQPFHVLQPGTRVHAAGR